MTRARSAIVTSRRPAGRLKELWASEVGLSVFTGLLALEIFVVSPLANLGVLGTGLIDAVFSLLLIWGALALHPGRILQVLVVILVGIAIALRWMAAWQPTPWIVGAGSLLLVVTLGCFVAIVLKRVFGAGPVTRHRIHGAVCAYLLFGLMWAAAYAFVGEVVPTGVQRGRRNGARRKSPRSICIFQLCHTHDGGVRGHHGRAPAGANTGHRGSLDRAALSRDHHRRPGFLGSRRSAEGLRRSKPSSARMICGSVGSLSQFFQWCPRATRDILSR